MNVRATLAGGLAVTAATIAAAMVMPETSTDYATLPPAAEAVERLLKTTQTRLGPAIAVAEQRVGGIAGSATMHLDRVPPIVEVTAYADGRAQLVSVDATSGSVIDVRDVPRFPGVAVEGNWTETSTGLKYYDIVPGTGPAPPSRESSVEILFTGYLVNGEQFGSSGGSDTPTTLPLSAVPPGLAEGISTMRVGGQRKLIIPADLAYGATGGRGIPPNATMIFDVELVALGADYSTIPETLPGAPVTGAPVKLPSGLMYYELAPGNGEVPAGPETVVRVHYTGWTNDGKKFDSSYDHPGGNPYKTALNRVIQGWTEGVGAMKVGGKRKLIIPFEMGYGPNGGQGIPPRAVLIFDVELVEIVSQ